MTPCAAFGISTSSPFKGFQTAQNHVFYAKLGDFGNAAIST
jgi:hypothetical protein